MLNLEKVLNKIIKYGLYAILLIPLVFWPRALYAFATPKFILFQVLVEIVFAAWLSLKVLNNANIKNHYANDANRESKSLAISGIRNNYILLALLCFTAVSFISALFGVDFLRSFWGIGARMTGIFTELHFFAWFLVLASSLNNANNANDKMRMMRIANNANRESGSRLAISGISNKFLNWHYYLNFSFFVALAVAATAFYQNSHWALATGSTVFNNPTFVAPYLIFHLFWGLYQFFNRSGSTLIEAEQRGNGNFQHKSAKNPHISASKKWFFGSGVAFLAFVILLIRIRGAILGLLFGLLFLGLGLIFSNIFSRRLKILLFSFYFFIFLSLAGIWFARESFFVKNISILSPLTHISLTETTAQTRIMAWQTALESFADHPILGAGPENFNYVFNAHYNPKFLKFGGGGFGETWFDKPHNAFLEIITEIGIIGGLAYLFIWLAVASALFKLFKSGQKILTLILASAFTAYLGSVFFAFDSFGSWFGLFLLLAFIASHNNTNKGEEMRMPRIANFYSRLTSLAILLAVLALLWINLSIWRANIADADALRIFPRDPEQGIILFKKSLSYFTPYKSEYQFDLIASVAGAIEKGMPMPNLEDTVNFSLGEADKAVAAHPKDAAKYTDMIRIYNVLGTRGRDPEILSQAEAFGNKSLELSPQRQETLYYLARTALLKNDAKTAVILAKQAVLADPDVKQSRWYLGLAYIANNQKQEGIDEIKKAINMGYKPQNQAEANFIKSLGL